VGSAAGNADAEESLATFRKYYPGKSEDIEQVRIVSWPLDPWASACERVPFPGQLARFWPKVRSPMGGYFAGAYADNLGWGMEAATRSANRSQRPSTRLEPDRTRGRHACPKRPFNATAERD
jgi:monoamine oxidase